MKNLTPFLVAALMALVTTVANAHARLLAATPKPNAVLTTSPTEIRLVFSETLEVIFCGLEVDGKNGKPAKTGLATANPNDGRELVVPVQERLTPGVYTVNWHAVGVDTNRVLGHYSFRVTE